MARKPIYKLVDQLPTKNMTTRVLSALDFVVPGQWNNLVGFENTIREVSGETDEKWVQRIGERAIQLYNDRKQGYKRALRVYETVDNVDRALASAALAHKVGDRIKLLSFMTKITPKSDTAQTIDLALKIVAELGAFCLINGLPGDSLGEFAASLANYGGESLMRMGALVSIDGIIPLGPDFIQKVTSTLEQTRPRQLSSNKMYKSLSRIIPGRTSTSKLRFVTQSVDAVSDWMNGFVAKHDLTRDKVLSNIKGFVEFSDNSLDYLAAFLDLTTNYYEHTGTQTLARQLIERAVNEI
jgi:hypothetical protein